MLLPLAWSPEPTPSGWEGVRRELWRAARLKLLVLFVLFCWTVGLAFGGPRVPRTDAGDLSVVPGHAPTGQLQQAPTCPPAGAASHCR